MIIPCCCLASLLCKMLQCPKAFAEETALPNSSSKKMQLELLQLWLCHAVSCHFMLCHDISCCLIPLHAISCYVIPFHATSCYFMLSHSISCHFTLFLYVILFHAISCYFSLFVCHVMWGYFIPMSCCCHAISCHLYVLLVHAISCHFMRRISMSRYFMLQLSHVLRCFQSKP